MIHMSLIDGWKNIVKKAWSVRLMIIAGILSGLEVILPFFMANLPQGLFSVFAIVLTTAALIARVVAQKGVEE